MKYIFLLLSTLIFTACTQEAQPKPLKQDKIQTIKDKKEPLCPKQKPCKKCSPKVIYKSYKKPLIGEIENIYLPELKLILKARIDTGATSTSIDARNIVAFERDGAKWVRFEIIGADEKPITVKKPIQKIISIKQHKGKAEKRFVIKMRLNITNLSIYGDVSLTDRSKYNFPVLIGRNFLQGNAIVDVSSKYTNRPTKVEK